jgi:glycosyltransferase involved in cell wall biosynthesis
VTAVHVVVPEGIDDPARPSGGNTYDRRVFDELTAQGWAVHEHAVAGPWPQPDAPSLAALDDVLTQIPDDSVVLLDGLVASAAPNVLVPQAQRLRLIALVHMALGHRPVDDDARLREQAVLQATTAVVTTSGWTRRRLVELYGLSADHVRVAEPAVDGADLAAGTRAGGSLLCVAAVIVDKGHDLLVDALAATADLAWDCVCAGSLDREPGFVEALRRRCADAGLDGRVAFAGPLTRRDLDRAYATADLVVLPSRGEAYGMVVTEALARGVPVLATDVGGVSEALGVGADGVRPGLLVPADDPQAFAGALRAWLTQADLRERLAQAARERRAALRRWSATASDIAGVLAEAAR